MIQSEMIAVLNKMLFRPFRLIVVGKTRSGKSVLIQSLAETILEPHNLLIYDLSNQDHAARIQLLLRRQATVSADQHLFIEAQDLQLSPLHRLPSDFQIVRLGDRAIEFAYQCRNPKLAKRLESCDRCALLENQVFELETQS